MDRRRSARADSSIGTDGNEHGRSGRAKRSYRSGVAGATRRVRTLHRNAHPERGQVAVREEMRRGSAISFDAADLSKKPNIIVGAVQETASIKRHAPPRPFY